MTGLISARSAGFNMPHRLRISGGKFRGRYIDVPNTRIRPAEESLRSALFSILHSMGRVPGERFLDVFAGSGSFSFEALSRGFKEATAIEVDPRAVSVIVKNASSLGVKHRLRVHGGDFRRLLPSLYQRIKSGRAKPFDVVVASPPYRHGLEEEFLNILAGNPVVCEGGIVVVQHSSKTFLERDYEGEILLRKIKNRSKGDTVLSFYIALWS